MRVMHHEQMAHPVQRRLVASHHAGATEAAACSLGLVQRAVSRIGRAVQDCAPLSTVKSM
jgi:hypothetical protein